MEQRELKFRVWNDEIRKMYIADAIFFKGTYAASHHHFEETFGCEIGPGDSGNREARCYSPTVMQYIGRKDKNGNEIYEGDLVRDRHGTVVQVAIYGYDIGCVIMPETFNIEDEVMTSEVVALLCPIEVIGNIYENPELIS